MYDTRQAFHAWEHKVRKHQVNCMSLCVSDAEARNSQATYTSVIPKYGRIGECIVH